MVLMAMVMVGEGGGSRRRQRRNCKLVLVNLEVIRRYVWITRGVSQCLKCELLGEYHDSLEASLEYP